MRSCCGIREPNHFRMWLCSVMRQNCCSQLSVNYFTVNFNFIPYLISIYWPLRIVKLAVLWHNISLFQMLSKDHSSHQMAHCDSDLYDHKTPVIVRLVLVWIPVMASVAARSGGHTLSSVNYNHVCALMRTKGSEERRPECVASPSGFAWAVFKEMQSAGFTYHKESMW